MAMHILARLQDRLSPAWLGRVINLWPPLLGTGIKVTHISADYRHIDVVLKLHFYNTNYVGTHFGGSIFSMTDPFFMLMLLKNLGKDYIVWDKAASIEFKKPGRGTIKAVFTFTEAELQTIKTAADQNEKYIFDKPVDVFNEHGEIVASVIRTLYVKRKDKITKTAK